LRVSSKILKLFGENNMKEKKKIFNNSGSMIGVGTAIGAAVFAATGEATWIAVGVAIGAALSWRKTKK
jgi:hypothetical protein